MPLHFIPFRTNPKGLTLDLEGGSRSSSPMAHGNKTQPYKCFAPAIQWTTQHLPTLSPSTPRIVTCNLQVHSILPGDQPVRVNHATNQTLRRPGTRAIERWHAFLRAGPDRSPPPRASRRRRCYVCSPVGSAGAVALRLGRFRPWNPRRREAPWLHPLSGTSHGRRGRSFGNICIATT